METDRQLVEQVRRGERAAFRTLVERYQQRVFAVALGLLRNRDDAKDICQETFLRVHRGIESFDGDSQLFTWIYRIAYNLCIDHLRRRRFETVPIDERIADGMADPDLEGADPIRRLEHDERRARMLAALEELTPAHRAVLTLREVEGLSYKEIAQVVGCSIGTVMSRLFHARKNLERRIREQEQTLLELAA
jgi:RNA polymerase sigma-70 factor (ECF subfamily)